MLSEKIQNWISNSAGYIPGLALLKKTESRSYSALKTYLDFPVIPEHAYNSLTDELRAYLISNPIQSKALSSVTIVSSEPESHPALKSLKLKGKNLLKERDAHRAQLVQMVDNKDKFTESDRGEQARIIMSIQKDVDQVYQQIELFADTGEIVESGSVYQIQQDTIKKMNRMSSLRSAISRLNRKINQEKEAVAKQNMQAELLAKNVELNNLAEELDLQ